MLQANRNKVNGKMVVFKKKETNLLINAVLIVLVNVYLFSHYVSCSIMKLIMKLAMRIPIENIKARNESLGPLFYSCILEISAANT